MNRFQAALAAAVLSLLAVPGPGIALETDQYVAWGRDLQDAAPALNAWFTRELRAAVEEAGEDAPCADIVRIYQGRLRVLFIIHPPEVWASSSALVDRYPRTPEEELAYPREFIYRNRNAFNITLWMPFTPTVQVGGVRIGTDKLSHFVSVGWQLYRDYRKLLVRGLPEERAVEEAVVKALRSERYLMLGYRTSGVLSLSDLESDVQGLFFYRGLCGGTDPVLRRTSGGWTVARPVDLRRHVTPEWDESYQPQVFRPGLWAKVRPVVETHCRWLDDPWLVSLWKDYAARDGLTLSERAVLQMAAEGKIPDPLDFSIESVCGRAPRPLDGGARSQPPPPPIPGSRIRKLESAIAAEEASRRFRAVGLWEAGWSSPQAFSGGLGVMAARALPGDPCHLLCEFRGPYLQVGAGTGGGRFSLGWGRLWTDVGRSGFIRHAYMGYGFRATLLRTWHDPVAAPRAATYVGPEVEISIDRVNIVLGALRRTAGPEQRAWIFSWSLGFGF